VARSDADLTVALFAARLKDAVDLDSVRDDLASVVVRALEPAHVWVWTKDAARDRLGCSRERTRGICPAD
jgi:hypothetical protein